eukprot:gene1804-2016_t
MEHEEQHGPPSTKKRGVGKKDNIKTAGKQNAFNSRQIRQLGVTMDNWWKRTNTPAIALSLATDKDGNLTADYIGREWFQDFGKDPQVCKRFIEVALAGMERCYYQEARMNDEPEAASLNTDSHVEGIFT